MSMKRGTTPTITINVDGMSFQGYRVFVTLEDSASTQITHDSSDATHVRKEVKYDEEGNPIGCIVRMTLSQDETLSLAVGRVQVQLTWIDVYGVVGKSDISTTSFDRTLLEQEVSYGA